MKNRQNIRFLFTTLFLFISMIVYSQPVGNPFQNPYGNTAQPSIENKSNNNENKSNNNENKSNNVDDKKEEILNNSENKIDAKDLNDVNANKNLNDKNYTTNNKELKQKKKSTGDINTYDGPLIYGMDFFTNSDFTFSDNNSITPPASYRIGAGDEIIVNIWGSSEAQQTYIVNNDGSIFPKYIGKIYVQGLTFESAKNVIESKFKKIVANGSTIDVQMGKVRTIKVNLKGEVKRPGTYTVSAFNTAINVISAAGGVSQLGDLRNIKVLRNGNLLYSLDLYEFIKGMGENEDLYLQDNDDIVVDIYDRLVKADGSFKRPMFYELKKDENLSTLIELTGGPTFDARYSNINITSITNETAKMITINYKDLNAIGRDVKLMDGDIVTLNKINLNISNSFAISGAVNYPSNYEITEGERLLDAISKAGGLKNDAYITRAFIFRSDSLSYNNNILKIDLSDISKENSSKNVLIYPGDNIQIISKSDFYTKYYVNITGEIKKPGKFEYINGLKLKDVLILSGGLTLEAENGRIEIATYVDSFNNYNLYTKNKTIITTITINPNLVIDEKSENIIIHPNDRIYVRRKINYTKPESIKITGEVNYPGDYALISTDETISSIIERAGGLKENAKIEGARLSRRGIGYIVVKMDKVLNNKGSKFDIKLKDGDSIAVPTKNDIISVSGQVLTPINIKYTNENHSLKYYINAAGGFSIRPWKNRISVIYQNGKLKTTKRRFFIRKYPKIETGCNVFIPIKPLKERNNIELRDFTSFVTSMASTMVSALTVFFLINKI